jgi:hypothetical protein
MKLVKQEHVMEEDLGEAHNLINVEFKFIFATDAQDTEDQEIYKFMRQIMGDAINSNIKVKPVENETIFSAVDQLDSIKVDEKETKKQTTAKEETKQEVVSDEFLPLSGSEQIVYDYIQKPAPEGKTFDIVWRWPAVKPVPEEVSTFINCKTHGEARIVRYSYTTRINPSDKHNFWISHAKKINGDFCEEDLEVDKLVELFDASS